MRDRFADTHIDDGMRHSELLPSRADVQHEKELKVTHTEIENLRNQTRQLRRQLLRIIRKIDNPEYHRRWLRRLGRY